MKLLTSDRLTPTENVTALCRGARDKERAEEPWLWEPGWSVDPETGAPIPPTRNAQSK